MCSEEKDSYGLELDLIEKALIKQSWYDEASLQLSERGLTIFVKFFESHPIYKMYFKQFRDVDMKELRESPKLRGHSTKVMQSLSDLVDTLEDPEALNEIVLKLGQDHYTRGVRPSQYRELFSIITSYLEMRAGKKWDPRTGKAWHKLFSYMVKVIDREMDKLAPPLPSDDKEDDKEDNGENDGKD